MGNFRTADPDQGLVFKADRLAQLFPLKEGDIFSATKIRKEFGLDAAQAILGHARISVTQVYAERSMELAREVAAKIG